MRYIVFFMFCMFSLTSSAQKFVSGIKLGISKSKSDALGELNGYHIMTWHGEVFDFNKGQSPYYIFLGVKRSDDVTEAIRDIILFDNYPENMVYKGLHYAFVGDMWAGIHSNYSNLYYTKDWNTLPTTPVLTDFDCWQERPEMTEVMLWNNSGGCSSRCLNADYRMYLFMTVHNHNPECVLDDANYHHVKCTSCGCSFPGQYPHEFVSATYVNSEGHITECIHCGLKKNEKHTVSGNYSVTGADHGRICEKCGYNIKSDHDDGLHTHFYNVDNEKHMTRCDICAYNEYEKHTFDPEVKVIEDARCSANGIGIYTCIRCNAEIRKAIPKLGHEYDEYGVCTHSGCTAPYEPAEYDGTTNTYLILNYGNLVWFSDYVNAGNTAVNGSLQNSIIAPDKAEPFEPIGKTSDLDYNGHFYSSSGSMICNLDIHGYSDCSGLFGYVGKEGRLSGFGMKNDSVQGKTNTGVIAGVNNGKISDCFIIGSKVTATGIGGYVGGICGKNNGMIVYCNADSESSIGTGNTYNGGICGMNTDTLMNCISNAYDQSDKTTLLPMVGYGEDVSVVIDNDNYARGSASLIARAKNGISFNPYISDAELNSLGIELESSVTGYDNAPDEKTESEYTFDSETDQGIKVYNIFGILMHRSNNEYDALKGLPSGMYIMNGRKVYVK